jgi:hypothetical protein
MYRRVKIGPCILKVQRQPRTYPKKKPNTMCLIFPFQRFFNTGDIPVRLVVQLVAARILTTPVDKLYLYSRMH